MDSTIRTDKKRATGLSVQETVDRLTGYGKSEAECIAMLVEWSKKDSLDVVK